jgi:NAD(P)-dependent dehydrogenase (short-subunit alcohol dehydrogenase family)
MYSVHRHRRLSTGADHHSNLASAAVCADVEHVFGHCLEVRAAHCQLEVTSIFPSRTLFEIARESKTLRMNTRSLAGKKVVVIGAGSGMGRSIARLASDAGARVVLAGRTRATLELAASDIGNGATVDVVDTTSESSVELFFKTVGSIDHLAIPGSSVRTGTLKEASLDDGLYTMQSKFWGPYLCAKHARFNEGGSLVLFSGILSRRPGRNDCVLAPVNAAVEALGRALARDLAPIRVNVLSPGMTSGTDAYLKMPEAARAAMYHSIGAKLPVAKVGSPDEIASAVLMLMENTFITGIVLDVDGGGLLV